MKAQVNTGRRREIYYFRDEQGLEVDFLVPQGSGKVMLVECKSGRTVTPAMAAPMRRLANTMIRSRGKLIAVTMFLVHQSPKSGAATHALSTDVRAMPWQTFLDNLR